MPSGVTSNVITSRLRRVDLQHLAVMAELGFVGAQELDARSELPIRLHVARPEVLGVFAVGERFPNLLLAALRCR